MAPIRRFLLRLLSFFRSGHAEAELAREIHSHLQLLEDKFLAEGMSPGEARSAARRAFGGVEQAKEHQRDTRSFRGLAGWWLDFKLGLRLLIKYPGLTLVGGLAIAFAIAVGACVFELVSQLLRPTLPLEDGERIVGIRNWDAAAASVEAQALHDVDYFDVLGAPILSGRGFRSSDLGSAQGVVIVNQSFVRQILGNSNAIGRRVRFLDPEDPDAVRSPHEEPGPWQEIVGVVKDLGMTDGSYPGEGAGLYQPMALDSSYPVHMAVHVGPDPASFAPRLRGVATAVDPTLRLYELQPLDEIASVALKTIGFWFRLVVLGSSVALLLSLAGIYSVMSFTVARRTREIGIRSALGADPRRIVAAIFSRAFAQFGLGVAAGGGLVLALIYLVSGDWLSAKGAGLFTAYIALMMGVCTLACIVPTRRALRIQPTEAMRADR